MRSEPFRANILVERIMHIAVLEGIRSRIGIHAFPKLLDAPDGST